MTREEIWRYYEEALEQASKQHEKALREAKEWCLRKLAETRQLKENK